MIWISYFHHCYFEPFSLQAILLVDLVSRTASASTRIHGGVSNRNLTNFLSYINEVWR